VAWGATPVPGATFDTARTALRRLKAGSEPGTASYGASSRMAPQYHGKRGIVPRRTPHAARRTPQAAHRTPHTAHRTPHTPRLAKGITIAYAERMKVLFIGGTRFVGLAMAREAQRRGHQVELFHRGNSAADLPGVRHLIGDRGGDMAALAQGHWDAVIDTCGYRPHELRRVAEALQGRGGSYVFISSISVYAEDVPAHSDETAPRADTTALPHDRLHSVPIDAATYGPLKALCEDEAIALHHRALIIRPTYVIGPDDYTRRFPQWVQRIAAGGEVLAPEPRDEPIQYIDARDLAAFVIGALERGVAGTFNLAGPGRPFSFGMLLETLVASVGPAGTWLHWILQAQAEAAAQAYPLWGGGSYSGLGAVSTQAARAQGLVCRPLADSARDVLAWLNTGAQA
jgi:2'-hydroxyisoflavone reductase